MEGELSLRAELTQDRVIIAVDQVGRLVSLVLTMESVTPVEVSVESFERVSVRESYQ